MPLYGIINYYVGLRFRQVLGIFIPSLPRIYYWPLFTIIAMSYLGGAGARRFFRKRLVPVCYWLAPTGWLCCSMPFLFFSCLT